MMHLFIVFLVLLACFEIEAAFNRNSIAFAPGSTIKYFSYRLTIPTIPANADNNVKMTAGLRTADNGTIFEYHIGNEHRTRINPLDTQTTWFLESKATGRNLTYPDRSYDVSFGSLFEAQGSYSPATPYFYRWADQFILPAQGGRKISAGRSTIPLGTVDNSGFTQTHFVNEFEGGNWSEGMEIVWRDVRVDAYTNGTEWCTRPIVEPQVDNTTAYSIPRVSFKVDDLYKGRLKVSFTSCTIESIRFTIPKGFGNKNNTKDATEDGTKDGTQDDNKKAKNDGPMAVDTSWLTRRNLLVFWAGVVMLRLDVWH